MNLFAFTKKGMMYIVSLSLLFASYVSTVLINFASTQITGGHLMSTLLFQIVFLSFVLFAVYKKITPLIKISRVLSILTTTVCMVCAILSAANAEFTGTAGVVMGYVVMLFVSPFYGFGFIVNAELGVCLYGFVSSIIGILLPHFFKIQIERMRLTRKYK